MKAICKKCKSYAGKYRFLTQEKHQERCKNKNITKIAQHTLGEIFKRVNYNPPCYLYNQYGECPYFEEKENFVKRLKRLKCLLFTTIIYLYNRVIFNFKS